MLFRVTEDDLEPIQPSVYQITAIGGIAVYRVDGKVFLETDDRLGVPGMPNVSLVRRLKEESLDPILSKIGVDTRPFKLKRMRINQQYIGKSYRGKNKDKDESE